MRRSDSIRNNLPRRPKIPELPRRKTRNYGCKCGRMSCPTRPPGTEFLDAETRRQKSPPKWVSAHRDKNPGNEWPEIPAETPYLALCRKRAVCKDWMVVSAVRYETRLQRQNRDNREKYREKRKYLHKISDENCKNPTSVGVSWQKRPKTITGKKISVTGKLRKITGKKYSIRQFRREPRTNRFPLQSGANSGWAEST